MRAQARRTLSALRGMQGWQPPRRGDFTRDGSDWAFGAPVAAFKDGSLDAVACLEVRERVTGRQWRRRRSCHRLLVCGPVVSRRLCHPLLSSHQMVGAVCATTAVQCRP
jgi:hypothetical protein